MTDRNRLSGMLNFAAGLLAARENVRFEMGADGGIVLREEAVAALPGIAFQDDDIWMRLVRMRENPPPAPPERFADWIDGSLSNPDRPPSLHTERMLRASIEEASDLVEAGLAIPEACHDIEEADPDTGEVRISESEVLVHLEISRLVEFQADFETWMSVAWQPWAAEEAPRRKSIRIYQSLFKLHGMMQGGAGGGAFELVWGIGVARWQHGEHRLDIPVIERLADLELYENGDLALRPRLVRPQIVMAPYLALEVPQAHRTQATLEPMLKARIDDPDLVISPFDTFTYEDILQAAAARLTDSARFVSRADVEDGVSVGPPGPDLAIYGLWSIYARPRSENIRREDLQEMAREIERADSDEAVPEPLRGFVRHLQAPAVPDDENSFAPDFFPDPARNGHDWSAGRSQGTA